MTMGKNILKIKLYFTKKKPLNPKQCYRKYRKYERFKGFYVDDDCVFSWTDEPLRRKWTFVQNRVVASWSRSPGTRNLPKNRLVRSAEIYTDRRSTLWSHTFSRRCPISGAVAVSGVKILEILFRFKFTTRRTRQKTRAETGKAAEQSTAMAFHKGREVYGSKALLNCLKIYKYILEFFI